MRVVVSLFLPGPYLSGCLSMFQWVLWQHVSQNFPLQEHVYTVAFRAPELLDNSKALKDILTPRCDAWAFGLTLIEASGFGRFFDGTSPVKIVKQIQEYCDEMKTVGGVQSKRLKQALQFLDERIRNRVVVLLRASPDTRATCASLSLVKYDRAWRDL